MEQPIFNIWPKQYCNGQSSVGIWLPEDIFVFDLEKDCWIVSDLYSGYGGVLFTKDAELLEDIEREFYQMGLDCLVINELYMLIRCNDDITLFRTVHGIKYEFDVRSFKHMIQRIVRSNARHGIKIKGLE